MSRIVCLRCQKFRKKVHRMLEHITALSNSLKMRLHPLTWFGIIPVQLPTVAKTEPLHAIYHHMRKAASTLFSVRSLQQHHSFAPACQPLGLHPLTDVRRVAQAPRLVGQLRALGVQLRGHVVQAPELPGPAWVVQKGAVVEAVVVR